MILDLEEIHSPLKLQCDLCIVGSGAAGLALVSQMISTTLNVVILESGHLEFETATQKLYDVEVSGLPFDGATTGRFRVHGGSTTKWGGQALPLMPIDFEKRDWVANSGWPISYDELKPYYQRACQFLFVDNMNFDSDLFKFLKTKPPAFDLNKIWYHFSKWSPTPNIRENYLSAIKASNHCTLLLHANVTNIELNENSQFVQRIEASSLMGTKAVVQAKNFVICVGGIETARLLLANNHQQTNGIGNNYDLVGRFLQDHPTTTIGWIKTKNPQQVQRLFNVFHKRKLKYTVRCTAASSWQRQHRTLNMSADVDFVQQDPIFQEIKEIYQTVRQGHLNIKMITQLFHAMRHPLASVLPVWHYLLKGRNYVPRAMLRLGLTSEQEPNPESRVLLSEHTDALGIPLANIRWKLTALTYYSIQRFATTLSDELKNTGIGELQLEPWLFENSSDWMNNMMDQFHHMGVTRMHDSPHHGVVDKNCRVHGLSNLFIGSSAVFPTGGHSNPTLTIIALCMRLADRFKQELRH